MRGHNRFVRLAALLFCLILLSSCARDKDSKPAALTLSSGDFSAMDFRIPGRDLEGDLLEHIETELRFSGDRWDVVGSGVLIEGTTVTIQESGTYRLSGVCPDGRVIVDCGNSGKAQLVFSGLELTSSDGPAIYIRSANKAYLTMEKGSVNTVSSAAEAALSADGKTLDAAIYSRCDLTVNGEGSFTVGSKVLHGIDCKDDLVLACKTLNVSAGSAGVIGKDSIRIGSGKITVTSGTDGFRAENADAVGKGYLYLRNGDITVTSGGDGFAVATVFLMEKGKAEILAGGGYTAAPGASSGFDEWTSWSPKTEDDNTVSAKGIKAGTAVLISGGTVSVNSADDAIHSNGDIMITAGNVTVMTGDDALHADAVLSLAGGTLNVQRSHEGLEARTISVSGGNVTVTATEDGVNAAGSDSASLEISGGVLIVSSGGDGLDSNGTVTVTGGVTLINGPENIADAAFDHVGAASVSGGVIVALGSSGMASGFDTADGQGSILVGFAAQSAGTSFALCDENGKVIVSLTGTKPYSSALITAPEIAAGKTYRIVTGGTVKGADGNGYARNASQTGGTVLLTVEMTSELYSNVKKK